jgi:hypothetical protein
MVVPVVEPVVVVFPVVVVPFVEPVVEPPPVLKV